MSKTKTATAAAPVDTVFTKDQLLKAKTLGVPRDVLAAVLVDGETYTREHAVELATAFLDKEVEHK
jgi:hypothetical protein